MSQQEAKMAYLSEILGKPVTDPEGKVIGHLEDDQ